MVDVLRRLTGRRSAPDAPHLYVSLTIAAWPEDGRWVSQCIELDIASVGDTPDEAVEQAKDAVCSYLNTLEDLGEREAVFGARSVATYATPPAEVMSPPIPRDLADREQFQMRPFQFPVTDSRQHVLA